MNDESATENVRNRFKNENGTIKTDHRSVNNFDKFLLLMRKNFILQYRHKTQTIVQLLIPVLFTINLLYLRCSIEPIPIATNTTYNSFGLNRVLFRLVYFK